MKIKELVDQLIQFPDDMEIVMSSDGEGNSKSPLSDISEAMYVAETTWHGETYPVPEEIEGSDYYSEDDEAPESAVRVLVLWPTN